MSVSGKLSLFLALLLASMTILFFNYFPRYQFVSNNLIKNPDFSPDQKDWRIESRGAFIGGEGLVSLSVGPGDPPVQIAQTINLAPFSLVQLTCDFKMAGVVRGVEPWDTARVLLVSLDHDGKPLYNRPHVAVMQSGSRDWNTASGVFMTDRDVENVELILQLRATQGTMYVKSLALHQVTVKPEFTSARQWLLITWQVCGFLAIAWLGLLHIKNKRQALAGVLLLLIWIGILLPASTKNWITENSISGNNAAANHHNMVRPELQKFSFILSVPKWDLFKIGHLVLFGLLACLLASRNTYNLNYFRTIGMLAILALLTEIAQLFIPGRTPNLTDIFIDLAGALLGLMLKAGLTGCRSGSTGQNA